MQPVNVAYALLLAWLDGVRGAALFNAPTLTLLDRPPHVVRDLAREAAREGWLEWRAAGDVTDITFDLLLDPATFQRAVAGAGAPRP